MPNELLLLVEVDAAAITRRKEPIETRIVFLTKLAAFIGLANDLYWRPCPRPDTECLFPVFVIRQPLRGFDKARHDFLRCFRIGFTELIGDEECAETVTGRANRRGFVEDLGQTFILKWKQEVCTEYGIDALCCNSRKLVRIFQIDDGDIFFR